MSIYKKLCLASSFFIALNCNATALVDDNQNSQQQVEVINLNCANEYIELLPYLGRGINFPQFLVEDVNHALIKQNSASVLKRIECHSDVMVKTEVVAVEGAKYQALSALEMVFPLFIDVQNSGKLYRLTVNHRYNSVNLELPAKRSTSQLFEVLQQETK